MNKKLAEWMRGRNGADEMANCLLVVALILVIVNVFLRSYTVSTLALLLLGYAWFRMSSKNLERRENENAVFSELVGPLRPWLRNPRAAFAEMRTYKHLECPECGKRMRVPRGKGKLRVRCPQCHEKFEART